MTNESADKSGPGDTASIGEFLHSCAPFATLTAAEVTDIAGRMRPHRYAGGEVIIKQGERGVAFYLVRSGNVNIVRRIGGSEQSVNTLGPGSCFGERALIEDELRNASVVAEGDVELYVLAKSDFWKVLAQVPRFRGMIRDIDRKRQ